MFIEPNRKLVYVYLLTFINQNLIVKIVENNKEYSYEEKKRRAYW